MAKHIRIIPDCPECGRELTITHKSLPPYTKNKPWGSKFEAWYSCSCGFETEHVTADHKDAALKLAEEKAKKYCVE